ncbi:hypothetical protein LCGC14_1141340, partial [marine sediment metagenome]
KIDHLTIFNSTLTNTEVEQHGSAPLALAFHSEMNENSGQSTFDLVNNYEGLFAGMPTWNMGMYGTAGLYFDGPDTVIPETIGTTIYSMYSDVIYDYMSSPTSYNTGGTSPQFIQNINRTLGGGGNATLYEMPAQPDDFSFGSGSFLSFGDLQHNDGDEIRLDTQFDGSFYKIDVNITWSPNASVLSMDYLRYDYRASITVPLTLIFRIWNYSSQSFDLISSGNTGSKALTPDYYEDGTYNVKVNFFLAFDLLELDLLIDQLRIEYTTDSLNETGWVSPGTVTTVNRGTDFSSVDWLDVDNATTQDNLNAKSLYSPICDNTDDLRATNFSFSIPINAIIVGIEVEVDRRSTDTGIYSGYTMRDYIVQLRNSTTNIGSNKARLTPWYRTDINAYIGYGNSFDMWNTNLTPLDVNDNYFGVDLGAKLQKPEIETARIDHVRMKIYYTVNISVNPSYTSPQESWVTLDKATTQDDDNTYVLFNTSTETTSNWLRLTNFGFDIPSTAVIDGITVEMDRFATQASAIQDGAIFLRNATGQVGNDKSTGDDWDILDNDIYTSFGGISDTWGKSWSIAEINSNEFGLDLYIDYLGSVPTGAFVDHIIITIYYTIPAQQQQSTGTVRPDGDALSQWNSTSQSIHADLLNELIVDPTIPDTTDNYIFTSSYYQGTLITDEFDFETIDISGGTISEITIKLYANEIDIDSTIDVLCGGVPLGAQQLDMTSTSDWYSYIWSGLSLTQDDLDTMTVKIESAVPPVVQDYDYVQFGDILDNPIGNNYEFTIAMWVNPSLLLSTQSSHGTKNTFLSKNNNLELGVSENGLLQIYLNTNGGEATAEYGVINGIPLNQWTFISLRFSSGNVDAFIGEDWYYSALGANPEPFSVGTKLLDGGSFVLGMELDTLTYFTGDIDDLYVFSRALGNLELEDYKGIEILTLSAQISKEDGQGGWTPILNPSELIEGYVNLQCNASGTDVQSIEFYLSDTVPDLQSPIPDNWSLITNISYTLNEYSYVLDTYDIPDNDSWYLIVKAVDVYENYVYTFYATPFKVEHFDELINFNYLDKEGRINENSQIGVVPHEGQDWHLTSLDVYVNYSGVIDFLTNVSFNDLYSNYWLIYLDSSLSDWIINKGFLSDNYDVNFIFEANLTYSPEFGDFLFNYTLGQTILDIKPPEMTLLSGDPYSLDLGQTYDDPLNNTLTMAIYSTDLEIYSDDFSISNWNLYNVPQEIFDKTSVESVNYLLDNYSLSDNFDYAGVHFDVGAQDSYSSGITWDGTNFWVVAFNTDEVYKYTAAGVYTGTHFNVGAQEGDPTGITWDGANFWVVGWKKDEVYKYTAAGDYTGTHFDVGAQEGGPTGITWDGANLWVIGYNTDEVYKYMNDYDISKYYQDNGYAYMQTDITEIVSIMSQTITPIDPNEYNYFIIDLQSTAPDIELKLLNAGSVVKTLTVLSNNVDYSPQTIVVPIDEHTTFDQFMFTGILDDTEYFKVENIRIMSTDLKYVKLEYKYLTPNTADWIYYDSFELDNNFLAPITWNIENLRDDQIAFRFISYDNLGNSEILSSSDYWIIKDFNNHLEFTVEGLSNEYFYTLDQDYMINLDLKAIPVDNDITRVVISTNYETFTLTDVLYEQGHIFFEDSNIKLTSALYNVFGSEFSFIPVEVKLYQQNTLISSKIVIISVITETFDVPVEISNLTISTISSSDNIWMSFTNGTAAYNNSHSIPYIPNNNPPVVKIYNSYGELVRIILLYPSFDYTENKIYDAITVNITNNQFVVSLPTPSSGELCSIETVYVNGTSYLFSYFINSKNSELLITLLTDEVLDGSYNASAPISIDYGVSTGMRLTDQFVASFDFSTLSQDNYSFVAEFYDVLGSTSNFQMNGTIFVDFEGPNIYNQFSNGISINPNSGVISFIINDLSDIDSFSFNTSITGYWTVIGDVYTFFFNDISILEGLTNIKFIFNDALGYESELDISLLFDRSAPVFSNVVISSYIMSDICEINVTISDISQYTLGIALIQQSSGISISNIEFTLIELSENNYQITFDSSQLQNGYYDVRLTSIDLAGNVNSDILQSIYFDNFFPQITSINEQIYA